jgi:NAD+ diphosphatase
MMMANLRSARHGIHAIQRLYGMQGSVARNGTWRPRLQSSVARAVPKLHFDRFPLDRAGEKRQDPVSVNALMESPDSIVVVFVDGRPVVGPRGSDATRSFCCTAGSDVLDAEGDPVEKMPWVMPIGEFKRILGGRNESEMVFLGLHGASPVFTASIPSLGMEGAVELGFEVVDARRYGPKLAAEDASVLATASGLLSWHRNARYDPRSGEEASEIVLGGHGRRVPGQRRAQYPRIDPAVIVGVEHGDWLLLGRKKSWVPGRYSLLAGFVELAESLEDAACREVYEESGVVVSRASLAYHSCQPWPFPRSLMVGFVGHTEAIERAPHGFDLLESREAQMAARGTGILEDELNELRASLTLPKVTVDELEMEDIRWFHASYLREQLIGSWPGAASGESEMRIPGKHAVASWIIHESLERLEYGKDSRDVLDVVRSVDLGPDGLPGFGSRREMKYVLMRVGMMDNGQYASKFIVRGDPRAAYHNNIFTQAKTELRQFDLDVLGGGRIVVDDDERRISVYGYSAAFGPAVHEISQSVLRRAYPLHDICVSYDGY